MQTGAKRGWQRFLSHQSFAGLRQTISRPCCTVSRLIPEGNSLRCLGMMFYRKINLHRATEEAPKPCLVGMACVCTFAH
eukprot:1151643-Pelagomonas_calceolata.AAC.2